MHNVKYFQLVNLVNGHGFMEIKPDKEVDRNIYLKASSEEEFMEKLNEHAQKYSNDYEIMASFEDGCGDILYYNKDFKFADLKESYARK